MKKIFKIKKFNKYYFIGSIIAFAFIIMLIVTESAPSLNWTIKNEMKTGDWAPHDPGLKYPVEHTNWITPFYFTFQSNILVFVLFILKSFGILEIKTKESHKKYQIITTINITITMILYWTLLGPVSSIWTHGGIESILKIIATLGVHLLIPIMMLISFHFDKLKKGENGVVLSYTNILLTLIYPIIWIIISISLYYITRKIHHFSPEALNNGKWWLKPVDSKVRHNPDWDIKFGVAVYFFLSFDLLAVYIPILAILTIAIIFVLISLLFLAISKPDSKLNNLFRKKDKKITT
ncbi:MAG: hypothetical protein GY679_00715 [Mycoplasma sp.]|nr:hypothetical protein [Mycoplasma sp.]